MKMNLRRRIEKPLQTTSEPELPARAGKSMADTYLLAVRCPVYRGRDAHSGFRTELENLVGDAKGKGTSGRPMRPRTWRSRRASGGHSPIRGSDLVRNGS
jgi:hypothetical protein